MHEHMHLVLIQPMQVYLVHRMSVHAFFVYSPKGNSDFSPIIVRTRRNTKRYTYEFESWITIIAGIETCLLQPSWKIGRSILYQNPHGNLITWVRVAKFEVYTPLPKGVVSLYENVEPRG